MERFCTQCGTKSTGLDECPSCGNKLNTKIENKNTGKTFSFSKKQKVIGGILAGVLLLGFVANQVISSLTSPERAVDQLITAINEEDSVELAALLKPATSSLEVTEETIPPLIKLIKNETATIDHIERDLNAQLTSINGAYASEAEEVFSQYGTMFSLEEKDGLFGGYHFVIEPQYLNLSSNYEGTEISVNGEHVHTTSIDSEYTEYGPLVPGIYEIEAIFEGEYTTLSDSQNISLYVPGDYPNPVDAGIYLSGEYIRVEGNFSEAEVYLNGESTGATLSELYELGPVPTDGSLEIFTSLDLPWGTAQSETIAIESPGGYYFEIDVMDSDVQETLIETINNYGHTSALATMERDSSLIENATHNLLAEREETIESMIEDERLYDVLEMIRSYDADGFDVFLDSDQEWNAHVDLQVDFLSIYYDEEDSLDEVEHDWSTSTWRYGLIYDANEDKWLIDDMHNPWSGWFSSFSPAETIDFEYQF
ncbi:hypothetical protein LGQ02_18400 [Bacillus shivajii]|uniref:zinc ribbon domain-containing protein n=1 Tax=Bacillus shivajii TaxID=1983719 RepID=UPI001CFBB870|nr:hypothetical protein [Bacillus shivajii]UCZ52731.1 hypothetical protein LGQ02_18400 [Bacillus shivajii]